VRPSGEDNEAHPDTCKQGSEWRGATPSDYVRATPTTRDEARQDNANPSNHVCVTPATRDELCVPKCMVRPRYARLIERDGVTV
jgi:hypothetical protein